MHQESLANAHHVNIAIALQLLYPFSWRKIASRHIDDYIDVFCVVLNNVLSSYTLPLRLRPN